MKVTREAERAPHCHSRGKGRVDCVCGNFQLWMHQAFKVTKEGRAVSTNGRLTA